MHDADSDADNATRADNVGIPHKAANDATDNTALSKLSRAVGGPTQKAAESAKALFPFIAFEAALGESAGDAEVPVPAQGDRHFESVDAEVAAGPRGHLPQYGSADRHPAASGG